MSFLELLPSLGLMILLLALNGIFVAIEFALVALSPLRVQELKIQKHPQAELIERLQIDIDTSVAGAQLGITLASLALGWVAEASIHRLIELVFYGFHLPSGVIFITSFVLLTALHVVAGEQVPKTWALRLPEPVTMALAYPFKWYCKLIWPLIWLMKQVTEFCLWVLRIPPLGPDHKLVHSPSELKILIEMSGKAGELEPLETSLLKRSLKFGHLTAENIMLAWSKVDSIKDSTRFQDVLTLVGKTKHSRIPVLSASTGNVVAVFYSRELFSHLQVADKTSIGHCLTVDQTDWLIRYCKAPFTVTEQTEASIILSQMIARRVQIAIVTKLDSTPAGIITLEDLVEELIGDVQDELDIMTK